jgi:hypothetical protein
MPINIGRVIMLAALCCCVMTGQARAQQQPPEDPEDNKKLGLWLDQGFRLVSRPASPWKSNSMNGTTR